MRSNYSPYGLLFALAWCIFLITTVLFTSLTISTVAALVLKSGFCHFFHHCLHVGLEIELIWETTSFSPPKIQRDVKIWNGFLHRLNQKSLSLCQSGCHFVFSASISLVAVLIAFLSPERGINLSHSTLNFTVKELDLFYICSIIFEIWSLCYQDSGYARYRAALVFHLLPFINLSVMYPHS